MPYTISKRDDEWCVYKKGEDGEPSGETLGCHDTEEKAVAQIGAIESSEDERSLVDRIVERIKVLFEPLLHPPPSPFEPRHTHISVYRQADGRWRWFSISATSVLNRVGEIDSRELFDNFIRRFPEQNTKPFRTFYHKGEAARMVRWTISPATVTFSFRQVCLMRHPGGRQRRRPLPTTQISGVILSVICPFQAQNWNG